MDILINTKLRRKLLAYFFTHAEQNFYVRELAAIINEDPGNLSRELRRFEKSGLFISTVRGRLRIFALSKKYPLYKQLKEIVFKTVGVEAGLKECVSEFPGISRAFLYGSYAADKERADSDIDVVVVGEFNRAKFLSRIRKLEQSLDREINFTAYTDTEFNAQKNNKGGFLSQVLAGKVIALK